MIYSKLNPPSFSVETMTKEYLTVPDATLSIKEILRRQMSGLPLPDSIVHEVQYSGDFIPPYARKGFDLADVPSVTKAGIRAEKQLTEDVESSISRTRKKAQDKQDKQEEQQTP